DVEAVAPPQKPQFDYARRRCDDPTTLTHEINRRPHPPSSGAEIIHHHNPPARGGRIFPDFDRVPPIFDIVGEAYGASGEFALVANHCKSAAEFVGEGGSNQKAAGFDADKQIGLLGTQRLSETVDCRLPSAWMSEQRGDVVEQNARLGEIRYR